MLKTGESKPTSVVRSIPLPVDIEPEVPLFIQMGSFSSHLNASNLVQNLVDADESAAKITQLQTDSGMYYRVRVGPLFDIDEANAILLRLRDKGFQTARIVVQDDGE